MFRYKKIPYWSMIPVIVISFLMYKLIDNIDILLEGARFFLSLISYLIWGFSIAYLLNPMMVYLEKKIKIRRAFSILIIYFIFVSVIAFGITIITPKIVKSVSELGENIPRYVETSEEWIISSIADLKMKDKYKIIPRIEKNINDQFGQISEYITHYSEIFVTKAINFTTMLFKFVFGAIISIYFLNEKERLIRGLKRIIYAILSQERASGLIRFGGELHQVFSRFIIGKTIDSLIIGLICFIGLMILDIPFALLISVIVGVSNMIPYFGPFIGAIPSVLIVLFVNPIQALWVLIFILLLQQFDGWYLGPKILGNQVGLSPLFIITAIIIGGGTFGVMGMFLAVPVTAVVKMIVDQYVTSRLKSKDIDL